MILRTDFIYYLGVPTVVHETLVGGLSRPFPTTHSDFCWSTGVPTGRRLRDRPPVLVKGLRLGEWPCGRTVPLVKVWARENLIVPSDVPSSAIQSPQGPPSLVTSTPGEPDRSRFWSGTGSGRSRGTPTSSFEFGTPKVETFRVSSEVSRGAGWRAGGRPLLRGDPRSSTQVGKP